MAGEAVIGALRVVLGTDTAEFSSGLKKASTQLDSFTKGIGIAGAAIGTALVGAAAAIGVGIKKAIDSADELGKAAQKIGIPVEQLSQLKHAADLSGVSMESLQSSVGRLSRNMAEAATNQLSKPALAFKALDINVRDASGALKPVAQIIQEIATKMEGMADGAGKVALGQSLMGRGFQELIPLLNAGGAGIRAMMQEADALGLTISRKTFVASEAFNDNLTRLGAVQRGVALKLTEELAPAFVVLTNRLVDWLKEGQKIPAFASGIIGVAESAIIFAAKIAIAMDIVITKVTATAEALRALATLNFTGALAAVDKFNNAQEAGQQTLDNVRAGLRKFMEDAQRVADEMAVQGPRIGAPIAQSVKAATDAMRIGEQEFKKFEEAVKKTIEETRTPVEQYRIELAKISVMLQRGAIDAETFGRAQQKAAERAKIAWQDNAAAVSGAASGFAALAAEAGKSNQKFLVIAKAFGIIEATINTYVAFTKALTVGVPPFNYIAAAGVLAAGLAKVVAIKSQPIPKMALGGSFTIPGGTGGADRRMVPIMGFPGERVTVERPDQISRGGEVREVTIRVDEISRATVEKLIPALNRALGDGHKLRIA